MPEFKDILLRFPETGFKIITKWREADLDRSAMAW